MKGYFAERTKESVIVLNGILRGHVLKRSFFQLKEMQNK